MNFGKCFVILGSSQICSAMSINGICLFATMLVGVHLFYLSVAEKIDCIRLAKFVLTFFRFTGLSLPFYELYGLVPYFFLFILIHARVSNDGLILDILKLLSFLVYAFSLPDTLASKVLLVVLHDILLNNKVSDYRSRSFAVGIYNTILLLETTLS